MSEKDKKLEKIIKRIKELAKASMERQVHAGITEYTWQTSEDQRTCEACAKNNGKVFRWDTPPNTGHPGEGKCCPNGHCRCQALAKIKL